MEEGGCALGERRIQPLSLRPSPPYKGSGLASRVYQGARDVARGVIHDGSGSQLVAPGVQVKWPAGGHCLPTPALP